MKANAHRVLCVDDHAFLLEGLRARLTLEPDIEVVGTISSLDGVAATIERLRPDIVLLDIEIPGGPDPFETIEDIHRQFPDVKVIMLSAYVRDHYIDSAVNAGAWGYLSKNDHPDSIVDAVRKAALGEFVFGPEVQRRTQIAPQRGGQPTATASSTSKLHTLTHREQQILRMIGKGMSRIDIAKAIHRSPKTVDAHRASIMDKLAIHDRVELARYAIREGLVEI
ncbi:MAG: response regulator transcription factor [Phycisphaerales bacterium]|nr:response regulator transcription factor [Phycisphaerales bacterium]